MSTMIALFRGINVGGKNILPMQELVSVFNAIGVQKIETYIQSGNVVFDSTDKEKDEIGNRVADAIESSYGFRPRVIVIPAERYQQIIDDNPYRAAVEKPATLHCFFLAEDPPTPDMAALDAHRADSEAFCLAGGVFYLHAPDGIGRSKLAAKVEKMLAVPTTARNWRSVTRIGEIARQFNQ